MTKPRLGRRQGVLLVLALAMLGGAGYRFWRQYETEAERRRGLARMGLSPSGSPIRRPAAPVSGPKYVVDVRAADDSLESETVGRAPLPSVRVTAQFPAGGEHDGFWTVLGGEERREAVVLPCRWQKRYEESPGTWRCGSMC